LDVEKAVDAWLAAHPQHNGKSSDGKNTPMVTTLADIMPAPVAWLWPPYLPLGKLAILEGDPEAGKTWIALVIAASLTRGISLPCPEQNPAMPHAPGTVVLMQGEDGIADTLRPRFDIAGGDPERLHLLYGKRATKSDRVHDITIQDLDIIEAVLVDLNPTLLVIDPLQAYLGANVDMHRANQTRPLLNALGRLAEAHRCTVLCIRHLSKSRHDRTLYRGLGSIDFSAAARSVLLAGFDPDDPQGKRRVLAHNKSSLAMRGTSLGYEISDAGFHWLGLSTVTAADLLAPFRGEETRSELEEAVDFLKELLTAAPRSAKDVQREAKHAGISLVTLRRAKKQLAVRSWREGLAAGQGRGQWVWGF
jgi:RecA-family ATPase